MGKKPHDPKIIETGDYEELREYITGWASGKYPFGLIEGRSGTGKSIMAEEVANEICGPLTEDKNWLKVDDNSLSKWLMHVLGFDYIDKPILIDDNDNIFGNKQLAATLKPLCNRRKPVLMSHLTDRASSNTIAEAANRSENDSNEEERAPRHYYTSSPVLIILNEVNKDNAIIKAVLDRTTFHLDFNPTNLALHEYASSLKEKMPELYSIGDKHVRIEKGKLGHMPEHTLTIRTYEAFADLRMAGARNWLRHFIKALLGNEDLAIIYEISQDPELKTARQREDRFHELTKKSGRTYRTKAKKLGLTRPYSERDKG